MVFKRRSRNNPKFFEEIPPISTEEINKKYIKKLFVWCYDCKMKVTLWFTDKRRYNRCTKCEKRRRTNRHKKEMKEENKDGNNKNNRRRSIFTS